MSEEKEIEVKVELVRETDDAMLVKTPDMGAPVWIPISLVSKVVRTPGLITIRLAQWKAEQAGLTGESEEEEDTEVDSFKNFLDKGQKPY